MNEKFYSWPGEKRQRIINSGLEVFAKNPYKNASTEEIAAKAGISKGLLFHYFRNKREFYNFLYQYGEALLRQSLAEMPQEPDVDFFTLLEWATQKRAQLLPDNPWLVQFSLRAYYSKNETISADIDNAVQRTMSAVMERYFQSVNLSKFREGMEPERILNMLIWLSDGYLHFKERSGEALDAEALLEEFRFWCRVLRQAAYKEEYLNGSNQG